MLSLIGLASGAIAADDGAAGLDIAAMGMGLFGGLAMFLFGMGQMSDALKSAAGNGMKTLLMRLTRNRVSAAVTGALVTAVIQSSSVTTVLVVGFVSAGMMTMTQSIGIIMGANVGTTITAHVVAFNVTQYALMLVAIGFGMLFFGKSDKLRHYGNMLMGLGLLFYGMGIMSDGMAPLRDFQPFIDLMATMERPLFGIAAAAVFTALVQSSSATTGIVIVMATQGFITLPAGIAMALGANIGTCATAMLSAIGKPTEAVRAAAVHVVFNVVGTLLWLGFIDQLANIAVWMSPVHPELAVAEERLAAETPRQIANANTAFNIINTIVFLGFSSVIARLVIRLVPERREPETVLVEAKFLDPQLLDTPALALNNVRMELGHMGGYVLEMIAGLRPALANRDLDALQKIVRTDDKVDMLQQRVLEYLGKIRGQAMSQQEADTFQHMMNAAVHLESAGDIVESELVPLLRRAVEDDRQLSEAMIEMLNSLGETSATALGHAIDAITGGDENLAQDVISMKEQLRLAMDRIYQYQALHLDTVGTEEIAVVRLQIEISERLKRLYTVAKRIAREVLPAEVASKSD
ncbi:MAG: Na/Pi cotransporter family protein [Gammaproteobacteria bacterium]|nr:Na/Pi cotransporter family protein [Gammaproteobacteria bacterium]